MTGVARSSNSPSLGRTERLETGMRGYVAHLWDYPELTIAIFGLQLHGPRGMAAYQREVAGELEKTLVAAVGLLASRQFEIGDEFVSLQYWRSHADLARFGHALPHTRWWRWLNIHAAELDIGFYHEIYRPYAAEAIYEAGTSPVGPATFATTSSVVGGEGKSIERQRRFRESVKLALPAIKHEI